ncbi:MAG: hypothetical protein ACRD22_08875 [Terriglobia bacterium]
MSDVPPVDLHDRVDPDSGTNCTGANCALCERARMVRPSHLAGGLAAVQGHKGVAEMLARIGGVVPAFLAGMVICHAAFGAAEAAPDDFAAMLELAGYAKCDDPNCVTNVGIAKTIGWFEEGPEFMGVFEDLILHREGFSKFLKGKHGAPGAKMSFFTGLVLGQYLGLELLTTITEKPDVQ